MLLCALYFFNNNKKYSEWFMYCNFLVVIALHVLYNIIATARISINLHIVTSCKAIGVDP